MTIVHVIADARRDPGEPADVPRGTVLEAEVRPTDGLRMTVLVRCSPSQPALGRHVLLQPSQAKVHRDAPDVSDEHGHDRQLLTARRLVAHRDRVVVVGAGHDAQLVRRAADVMREPEARGPRVHGRGRVPPSPSTRMGPGCMTDVDLLRELW